MFKLKKLRIKGIAWAILTNCPFIGLAETAQPENAGGGSGQTYYLNAVDGNDSNGGTSEAAAWASFSRALTKVTPGDTVLIMNGDYYERMEPPWKNWQISSQGAEDEYITFRNYPGHTPTFWVDSWNGIELNNAAYLELDGLEIRGLPNPVQIIGLPENHPVRKSMADVAVPGNEKWFGNGISVANVNRFIRIRNCHIHGVGGNGIGMGGINILLIEDNLVWGNSHRSDAGNSGISVVNMKPLDIVPENYGVVIRGNVSHSNRNMMGFKFYGDGTRITDGNGIILDWMKNYPYSVLVANNIAFNNGGRGVHAYETSNVDVIHNTTYYNNGTPSGVSAMTNDGEFNATGPNLNVNFHNNIAVARPGRKAFSRGGTGSLSAAEVGEVTHNLWVSPVAPSAWPTDSLVQGDNLEADPLFYSASVYPWLADFRLSPASPAIGYGMPGVLANFGVGADFACVTRGDRIVAGALMDQNGAVMRTVTVNGGTGGSSYADGSVVTIAADAPAAGKMFYRWRGDISKLADVYAPQTRLTVAGRDVLLTAQFKTAEQLPVVQLATPPGVYPDPVQLNFIAPQPGTRIYFTMDGSTPTRTHGVEWINQGLLLLDKSTIVKVFSTAIGYQDSPLVTAEYFIGGGGTTFRRLDVENGTGSGFYTSGSRLEIEAVTEIPNRTFSRWTGATGTVDDVMESPVLLTMPEGDIVIAARFVPFYHVEAEALPFEATAGSPERSVSATVGNHNQASGGKMVSVTSHGGTGQSIEFVINGLEPGNYSFSYRYRASGGHGLVSMFLNDEQVEGVVNQAGSWVFQETEEFLLQIGDSGPQRLRFVAEPAPGTTNDVAMNFDSFEFHGVDAFPEGFVELTVAGGIGGGWYKPGSTAPIRALPPASGMEFDGWEGDTGLLQDPAQPSAVITVPEYPVTLTARYREEVRYQLTVNNGSGSGDYPTGERIRVSADEPPGANLEFAGWSGDVAFLEDPLASATYVVMPNHPVSLTADYRDIVLHRLTVENGNGSGNYARGHVVEVSADPPLPGEMFAGWTGDTPLLEDPSLPITRLVMPDGPAQIAASYLVIELPEELAQPDNVGRGNGIGYYVSPGSGDDSFDGRSLEQPWKSFSHAIESVQPGDTVWLLNGDYYEQMEPPYKNLIIQNVGTPDAYITFRNYPGHTPTFWVDTWNGIEFNDAAYVELNGLEIRGLPDPVEIIGMPENHDLRRALARTDVDGNERWFGNAIAVAGTNTHLRIRNCHIHDVGGNGIGLAFGNVFLIEDNLVWNTSHRSDAGNSGITTGVMRSYAATPENYGIVIRNNISHSNHNRVGFKHFDGWSLTDGNGIIVDYQNASFVAADSNEREPYPYRTLVAGNIVFNNGGRGVHAFQSSHVDFVNNTAYFNNRNPYAISATKRDGELNSTGVNRDVNFYNNVAVARPGFTAFQRSGSADLLSAAEVGITEYNLWLSPVAPASWPPNSLSSPTNKAADPRFVNASTDPKMADFRLSLESPARAFGTASNPQAAVVVTDFTGAPWPDGESRDAGALHASGGPGLFSNVKILNGSLNAMFAVGSVVAITADPPAEGMMFHRWRGDITKLRDVYSAETHLLVPATEVILAAEYIGERTVPHFSTDKEPGTYADPIQVRFNPPLPGSRIFFTTDGSQPSPENGTEWINQGALPIEQSTILKARAFRIGYLPLDVMTYNYIIGDGGSVFHDVVVDDADGSGKYTSGSLVPLSAMETGERAFSRWVGDVAGLDSLYAPTATLQMPEKAVRLGAAYVPRLQVEAEHLENLSGRGADGQTVDVTIARNSSASNGHLVFLSGGGGVGSALVLDPVGLLPGRYVLRYAFRGGGDLGILQAFWNGVAAGLPVDLYDPDWQMHQSHSIPFEVEAGGAQELVLEVVDKNPSSGGYGMNLDALLFIGLDELPHAYAGTDRYSNWKTWRFPEYLYPQLTEPEADPDQDGWKNLLEYALDRDPMSGVSDAALAFNLAGSPDLLEFPTIADPDLEYVIEFNETLSADGWQEIWNSADYGALQEIRSVPLWPKGNGPEEASFFRLKLIQP